VDRTGRTTRLLHLLGVLAGVVTACALVACGGSSEGTVVVKTDQAAYDYGCGAGGTVTVPWRRPLGGRALSPSAGDWSCAAATAPRLSPA